MILLYINSCPSHFSKMIYTYIYVYTYVCVSIYRNTHICVYMFIAIPQLHRSLVKIGNAQGGM